MDDDSSSMYDSAFGSLYNTDSASASVDATSCNSGETASGQGERYEGMFSNAHIKKKMRRGCDADKVLRKTDEVQEATSQSKARSLARSARQVKPAKTIQAPRLTRSTKLF